MGKAMEKSLTKKRIALVLAALCLTVFLLCGCGSPSQAEPTSVPEPTETPDSPYLGKLRITELMAKNHASFATASGKLPDYLEIANVSGESIELEGFGLTDGEGKPVWRFPDCTLAPGEQLLILADGEGGSLSPLSCDFKISHGESVFLYDREGLLLDRAEASCDTADIALCADSEGNWSESLYPSPGYPNSPEGYDAWQESLSAASPLVINEAMVSNDSYLKQSYLGCCDWLEIKNVSGESVELSEYWLSDDDDLLRLWRFPQMELQSGQCVIVLCDESQLPADKGWLKAHFNLNSQRERVYLSHEEKGLCDFLFLRDIPYGCSYGRAAGENGGFFFASPSPGEDNGQGYRRVSGTPVALSRDGVFDKGGVSVELSGKGSIYYSFGNALPDESSMLYQGPFTVEETGIVRAICVEEGAMPSRALTLSYIIGEGHSLPVLSLVTDDSESFRIMYDNKRKDMKVPGSISLYESNGSFTMPCGIEMHGEASLSMPKKNMSVKFSGAYGQEKLSYDAFGGGVSEFTDFVLRSGQDFTSSIVKNELLENLLLQYSDSVPSQRSKHCVLYINGQYSGLYALMEKLNEFHYSSHYGVSEDSVTVIKAMAQPDSDFYREVIEFPRYHDLRGKEAYDKFCEIVDIDSLIDWLIIEGYSANTDISTGNVRYCRSTEGDGKWRFMLYDMDSTMNSTAVIFRNVLHPNSTQCSSFIQPLMKNPEFAHRFLTRAGEVLAGPLSDENVIGELDRLAELIDGEVERDYARFGMTKKQWLSSVDTLRQYILNTGWNRRCVDALCSYFALSESQREQYFHG